MRLFRLSKDQRRMVQELRKAGPLSRSALGERLEMSGAALTRLSRELLALGVLEELRDGEASGRGRPSVPLRLAPGGGYAVGATAHKGLLDIALVDFAGGTIATHQETIPPVKPQEFAIRVRQLTHALVDRHHLLGRRMLGMGIAVPGPALSPQGDRWNVVDALPGWRDTALGEILTSEIGWPLWIENDANAAALAEYYLGKLMDRYSTIVVMLLGHGIGAGMIVEGRLIRGQFGAAGEVGCLFPPNQPQPGPLGLLSALRASGCAVSSVAEIDPAAPEQRDAIEAWMSHAARQLELVCNTAFAWFDPGAIVLTGPLPAEIMLGLRTRLQRTGQAAMICNRRPPLEVSGLTGSPIALGAALLPIHSFSG